MSKFIVLFKDVDFDIASYYVNALGVDNVVFLTKSVPSSKRFARFREQMICDDDFFPSDSIKTLLQNRSNDEGWVFQQILKYQAVLAQSEEVVTIIDGDSLIRSCLDFSGDTIYYITRKPDQRYADFIRLALKLDVTEPDLSRNFISNHMSFRRSYLQNLVDELEVLHQKPWWESLCTFHDRESGLCLSEYQLYAHYILRHESLNTDKIKVFRRMDLLKSDLRNGLNKYDLVASEKYHKQDFARKKMAELRYFFGIDWS
jgi:hypothetical protein